MIPRNLKEIQRVLADQEVILAKNGEGRKLPVEEIPEKLPRIAQNTVFLGVDVPNHRNGACRFKSVNDTVNFGQFVRRFDEELNARYKTEVGFQPRSQRFGQKLRAVAGRERQNEIVIGQAFKHPFTMQVSFPRITDLGNVIFGAIALRWIGMQESKVNFSAIGGVHIPPAFRHCGKPVVAVNTFEKGVPDVAHSLVKTA